VIPCRKKPLPVLQCYRSAAPPKGGIGPAAKSAAESNAGETKIPHFVRDDKGFVRDDNPKEGLLVDMAVVCSVDSV
jgi:hypothetical protein